jgi:hypothetical protein
MGYWARVTAVLLLLSGQSGHSEPLLPLRLRVFDYAAVPAKALLEAKAQVSRIFHKAGAEPLWLHCPDPNPPDAACSQTLHENELIIRILAQTSTLRTSHLFGLAFVTPGTTGRYATVFYGEVRIRAHHEDDLEGRILGYAIAHEAGHLLLGDQHHAPTGIMSSGWTTSHLRARPKAFFLFTSEEAEQLCANLKTKFPVAEPVSTTASR